ncbi:GH1 family beta-glucosidase [Pseudobacteriovorax antillogorgiicola]|uniref:Beta-glucosidase n=1 Tax=Pseudobacteriovorax antillogorgiicola TaxID=1513793 RepID=A0A1Y6BAW6_9BACT|nr:GH1 family beta-glucosidase [Pseudobacteriovorax antillogorgiicola]TCS57355.1 beta-glucosidase [Pseudobacteriovorax antillogorgiicola]SMF02062.1 beta-glucosidase [Pseudobacteriovorax antillogorgiicola]
MFEFKEKSPLLNRDQFLFGTATSSFQIEGGADLGGRTPSIWDDFCLEKGRVKGGDDGRKGTNHFHLWKDDIDLIEHLNFDAYRFSLSWSRIIPARGQINEEGLRFYEDIIDRCNERGIKPFITLYHWDLPTYLEDRGGWINRETAYDFAEYAAVVAKRFGDKVSSIATLNEPFCSAFLGYLWGVHAPGYKNRRMAFQAAHHLMLAHGLGMTELKKHAPQTKNGIVLNFTPAYPASSSASDQLATARADYEHTFWFSDALFRGRYPEELINDEPDSKPCMMPGDMEVISQDVDFLGVNFYSRQLVSLSTNGYKVQPAPDPKTDIGWEVFPKALFDLFQDKFSRYDKLPPIYITENGAAYNEGVDANGEVIDAKRIEYYQQHLNEVERLIDEGYPIKGYFAWSLMDNFEWAEGYSQRFGIVHVDYETMKRTPKASAKMFKDLLASRS